MTSSNEVKSSPFQIDSSAVSTAMIGTQDKTVPWYSHDIGSKLSPQIRKLFETYSRIPAKEVEEHVYKVRDQAWQIWPYPCIGQFRFLDLSITRHPEYPTILSRLRTGEQKYLELGCCFGQEIRALVSDGVPAENLHAVDLENQFIDLGYELFKDKETLKAHFMTADLVQRPEGLIELEGTVDVCYAASFLHLFDYPTQLQLCILIARLLKPVKDSAFLGRQVGSIKARDRERTASGQIMRAHNEESWKAMWEEVGKQTGTRWRVEFVFVNEDGQTLVDGGKSGGDKVGESKAVEDGESKNVWQDEHMRKFRFAVYREE